MAQSKGAFATVLIVFHYSFSFCRHPLCLFILSKYHEYMCVYKLTPEAMLVFVFEIKEGICISS